MSKLVPILVVLALVAGAAYFFRDDLMRFKNEGFAKGSVPIATGTVPAESAEADDTEEPADGLAEATETGTVPAKSAGTVPENQAGTVPGKTAGTVPAPLGTVPVKTSFPEYAPELLRSMTAPLSFTTISSTFDTPPR